MVREEEKSRWWWFESHKKSSSNHSHWLHSTLSELDVKTSAMLKLIEGNADSFAQRVDIYYKKRPELINIVEDFYRAYRSLAERFDHLKLSDSRASKLIHHQESMESVCDSNSEFEDAADSEIENPSVDENEEIWKLEQEKLKLMEETDALRRQLLEKDEEKREVIRQLALTVETLKEENSRLKRRLDDEFKLKPINKSPQKRSVFEYKPIDKFMGKLFYIMCEGKKIKFSEALAHLPRESSHVLPASLLCVLFHSYLRLKAL